MCHSFLRRSMIGGKEKKEIGRLRLSNASTIGNGSQRNMRVLCSQHLVREDFSHADQGRLSHRWVKRDDVGIVVFPTILQLMKNYQAGEGYTERENRMVCKY